MTSPNRKDVVMSSGSVVFWSRRYTVNGRYFVPVQCGMCKNERIVSTSGINEGFTGLCKECGYISKRKFNRDSIEVLSSGSVIYWNKVFYKNGRRRVPIECGGPFCGGGVRDVAVHTTAADNFTGMCRKCAHAFDRSGTWTGGRKNSVEGYVLIKLPSNHSMYVMANSDGYVLEHRLVVALAIGRALTSDEIVHHKNGIKSDNRLENLELLQRDQYHPGYKTSQDTPS